MIFLMAEISELQAECTLVLYIARATYPKMNVRFLLLGQSDVGCPNKGIKLELS
jgi:hypothetical protein